jgi:hypothetical protein
MSAAEVQVERLGTVLVGLVAASDGGALTVALRADDSVRVTHVRPDGRAVSRDVCVLRFGRHVAFAPSAPEDATARAVVRLLDAARGAL